MILLCVTLHRVCYPNSNCVQDYMTPEQYQILFFSYEQFKQLNFFIVKVPHGLCLLLLLSTTSLSFRLFFPQMSIGQENLVLSSHKILYWLQKHRWDCTNFCGCKHCPNHAHHIVRYILQIFFSFISVFIIFVYQKI